MPASKQPVNTSQDLKNVRPYFDGRLVGGQRPGSDKWSDDRIGGADSPVVAMCSVTVIEMP